MIYLKDANVIFIKPKKVAGSSFEIALSQFAKEDDILTPLTEEALRQDLGFRTAQNYHKPYSRYRLGDWLRQVRDKSRPIAFYTHMSAREIRRQLGWRCFEQAQVVSIVRDPFDRLVSHYHWQARARFDDNPPPFGDWLRMNPDLIWESHGHYHIQGSYVIDHMLRYEHLLDDAAQLEAQIPAVSGLSATLSTLNAKAGIRPKGRALGAYYDEVRDAIETVRFLNRDIMDRFGYAPPATQDATERHATGGV